MSDKCPQCGVVHDKIRTGVDCLSVGTDKFLIAAISPWAFAKHVGFAVDELLCLRRQLSSARAEIEILKAVIAAQDGLISVHEDNSDRNDFDDSDLPSDLVDAERAVSEAKSKIRETTNDHP